MSFGINKSVQILRLGNLINSLRKHERNLLKARLEARLVSCEALYFIRLLGAVLGASC